MAAGSVVGTSHLVWLGPSGDHGKDKDDATPAYQTAMPQYNGSTGTDEWSDCNIVATVMMTTGAGSGLQNMALLLKPLTLKVQECCSRGVKDTSQLQPGDILINGPGDSGHTFIYTGQQAGVEGDSAAAWFTTTYLRRVMQQRPLQLVGERQVVIISWRD